MEFVSCFLENIRAIRDAGSVNFKIIVMEKVNFVFATILVSIVCMSFMPGGPTPVALIGTKWISPVSDTAYQSLCFNSENTVIYYPGKYEMSVEVGYTLRGDRIEIMAYGGSTQMPETMLVLTEDNGVTSRSRASAIHFLKFLLKCRGQCVISFA